MHQILDPRHKNQSTVLRRKRCKIQFTYLLVILRPLEHGALSRSAT